jgi:hypothetical protein
MFIRQFSTGDGTRAGHDGRGAGEGEDRSGGTGGARGVYLRDAHER